MNAFLNDATLGPFRDFLALLALPRERALEALAYLSAFIILCELVRLALGTTFTRSKLAQVIRSLLTFPVQALLLAAVLVWAAHQHPERAWINVGYALLLYGVWYAAGQLVLLARPDTEGADLGFMTVGALITFPVGILAAVV